MFSSYGGGKSVNGESIMPAKILFLTKQLKIFIRLNERLGEQKYTVFNVTSQQSAAQAIASQDFSAVLLDLDCIGLDETAQLIAQNRPVVNGPIIVLAKAWSQEVMLMLFALKIDDFLLTTVPFSELLARLKQRIWIYQTHRHQQPQHPELEGAVKSSTIHLDDLTIDLQHYQVTRDNHDLGLTPKEFKLLIYLINHNGQVLNREQILTKVWGYDELESSRIVDIHISHLRDKIELDSKNPKIIKTVRGFGYIFEDKNLKIDYQ
ncbi:DNA-binding response regulator [Lapidilactobacillus gannanensis]|uniref:DNA-binding response regulator n=2 Tax=Lapidilactobacillus gannanensis TaxID=2486002 RepID=A0ABW4BIX2_9LACO